VSEPASRAGAVRDAAASAVPRAEADETAAIAGAAAAAPLPSFAQRSTTASSTAP